MAVQAQMYYENLGFPLGSSQDLMILENACGLDNQFCPKPEKLQQQQHQQHQLPLQQQHHHQGMQQYQNLQNMHQSQNVYQSINFYQNFAALTDKQKQEIDGYISLQNERLKWALQEQRKQQLALILKKYEAKTQVLLRQKDEEIAKAANRTMELQGFLKKAEMEKQAWQRVANEKEAMVLSLNNTIEQLKETNNNNNSLLSTNILGVIEDAESCCDVIEKVEVKKQEENAEEMRRGRRRKRMMVCKGCNNGRSCIIMLPCRHLSLCKACEAFLDSCPVCGVQKKATIEALI